MNSKITLYAKQDLIDEIKLYAKNHNTSVSKLVNEFFKNLLKIKKSSQKTYLTDKLVGKLKGVDIDVDDYHKFLEKKYL